jgi:pimeloyl-ACP methyl ester carboxylesterase
VVQVAEKLRREYGGTAHVEVFENHHRQLAHAAVLKWLDRDRDGRLSDPEKQQARIILYGHSWGGAAVVALARQLEREHIPILLTIQVDSISKPGHDDRVIPANVGRAINFYQTRGPLHGKPGIVAADPGRTEILGDFRFSYKKEPEPCSAYPWFARHFLKGHISIECDPIVWSRVEGLITEYLFPQAAESSKPAG